MAQWGDSGWWQQHHFFSCQNSSTFHSYNIHIELLNELKHRLAYLKHTLYICLGFWAAATRVWRNVPFHSFHHGATLIAGGPAPQQEWSPVEEGPLRFFTHYFSFCWLQAISLQASKALCIPIYYKTDWLKQFRLYLLALKYVQVLPMPLTGLNYVLIFIFLFAPMTVWHCQGCI